MLRFLSAFPFFHSPPFASSVSFFFHPFIFHRTDFRNEYLITGYDYDILLQQEMFNSARVLAFSDPNIIMMNFFYRSNMKSDAFLMQIETRIAATLTNHSCNSWRAIVYRGSSYLNFTRRLWNMSDENAFFPLKNPFLRSNGQNILRSLKIFKTILRAHVVNEFCMSCLFLLRKEVLRDTKVSQKKWMNLESVDWTSDNDAIVSTSQWF